MAGERRREEPRLPGFSDILKATSRCAAGIQRYGCVFSPEKSKSDLTKRTGFPDGSVPPYRHVPRDPFLTSLIRANPLPLYHPSVKYCDDARMMDEARTSGLGQAKELSDAILTDLEINQLPISQILMKAKRLARLMHDSDAQKWLDYEIMGYPPVFDPVELGTCRSYYTGDRPVLRDERTRKPHAIGLPQLESYIHATKPDVLGTLGPHESQKIQIINRHHEMVNDFERLKTAIHNYVTEVNIALSVGEAAEEIFEDTRRSADRFIREHCPRAGEQLLAISEKMHYYDPDAFSQAIAAVKKVLAAVADAVVPANEPVYRDRKGRERVIGPDQYLNRIFSYLEQNSRHDPALSMVEAEMAYIFAKAEPAPPEKGRIAEPLSRDDVELAIIHMYLVIAEIAKIRKVETVYLNTFTSKIQ